MKQFFDEQASGFDNHILKSIPGFAILASQTKLMVESFASYSNPVLDVGCSSGKFLMDLEVDCPRVGIDYSDLIPEDYTKECNFIRDDFFQVKLKKNSFSVITSIFFLQFVDKFRRVEALKKMYRSLAPGGKLIVVEKLYFDDPVVQRSIDAWHRQYKRQSFTADEILEKDLFVAKDMPIATKDQMEKEFIAAGFDKRESFFSCSGFTGFVLTK